MAYINKNVSTMAMPSGMNRMGQFPLDMSSVFYSESELRAYATSGAIAYVGQIISLVDEVNNSMHIVNGGKSGAWVYDMHSKQLYFENNYPVENGEIRKKLADNKISWLDDSIFINKVECSRDVSISFQNRGAHLQKLLRL